MVKLLNPLYRFARLDSKGGRAARALRMKNALGLSYCRGSFSLPSFGGGLIPCDPLIAMPGHNP
jgi:hypothetical protein